MTQKTAPYFSTSIDSSFKIFHELMARKVRNVLLVSTPYDAWIMEEDGRLSERIITEYRGLNLSKPPRLTWVSTPAEALKALDRGSFDIVLNMHRLADADAESLSDQIKQHHSDLPIIWLSHHMGSELDSQVQQMAALNLSRSFVWSGNKDLLVSIVKSTEDRMNAEKDTAIAGVRVILFVEDSPFYRSSLLTILYQELVKQTRSVLEGTLNEEHRLLTMRARPKILVSCSYEQALEDFRRFEPYVLGVISDVKFPRNDVPDKNAGIDFLTHIKQHRFDIPLLLTSVDPANAERAQGIADVFIDKKSPILHHEVHEFFNKYLAFDDFLFRTPDGTIVGEAAGLRSFERCLRTVPAESLLYHARRNDFSRWLFTRTEITLATDIRDITVADYTDAEEMRRHLVKLIHSRRRERQRGIVANFDAADFDLVTKFYKIGRGSLGGKARGLAFTAWMLRQQEALREKYAAIRLFVPRTLVITTEAFEDFVEENDLVYLAEADMPDQEIADRFVQAALPPGLESDLREYLRQVRYPLAVRSSSLLEDAQFRAYAGLYRTYMLPNEHDDLEIRLRRLIHAVKLVYASTYYRGPKSFSKRVGRRTEEEQMAVIIQQSVGEHYGDFFYPAISGVAQSYNYYPFARMKPEEGIATIAMGFGRAVVEGEKTLRFSPARPQLLPQRSSVDDVLRNAQRHFYALRMGGDFHVLDTSDDGNLYKREIIDAADEQSLQMLASTYVHQEHRIRDTIQIPGQRVLTFSHILKYNEFPLANILTDALNMGQRGMGTSVELEFSVNFKKDARCKPEFAFLQMRPMTARADLMDVDISSSDVERAFCYSTLALGNALLTDIADIVYIKPDPFDRAKTQVIAREIGRMNAMLGEEGRRYVLIGPGRWGTADRWLGIPVRWADISAVGAIVETAIDDLQAEPSQGSHFFHNITTLGISYMTVCCNDENFIQWPWLTALPVTHESEFVAHVRLDNPFTLKVDGRTSRGVMMI